MSLTPWSLISMGSMSGNWFTYLRHFTKGGIIVKDWTLCSDIFIHGMEGYRAHIEMP